jgi:hypothetical protein
MVYFIWFIWFCTQFINLVILLNFLIAIISQSYEDVMSRETFTRYSLRSHMNLECLLILQTFGMINEMDIFVLSANDGEDGEGGDWHGFVQAIRSSMHAQSEGLTQKF